MKKFIFLLACLFFATNCFAQSHSLVKDTGKQTYRTTLGVENDEVLIGDPKSASFVPQIRFSKWGGENTLTLKLPPDLISSNIPTLSAGKLEVKDAKTGFYFNPDPDNSDNLKFGLILYEPPDDKYLITIDGEEYYQWEYQIEGAEELNFCYQPPLKNVNPDGSTWEYRDEVNQRGRCERPAEINGSYAIYHKTKRDHIIGQTNYQVGKFGNYHNILWLDSTGKSYRQYLFIKDGIYYQRLKKSWAFSAQFPIKANDTFGNQDVGATEEIDAQNNDPAVSKATTTPSANGALTSISLWCKKGSSGSPQFSTALYADSSQPTTNLASTETGTALGTTAGWVTTNLSYASIVSGTQYWLGLKSGINNALMTLYMDTTSGVQICWTGSQQAWMTPFSYSGSRTASSAYSIYATYTPSGGGARRIIFTQ